VPARRRRPQPRRGRHADRLGDDLINGLAIKATETRSGSGQSTSCDGSEPLPTDGCASRSWWIVGDLYFGARIRFGDRLHDGFAVSPREWTDSLEQITADDEWRQKPCGNDNGTDYLIQTDNGLGGPQRRVEEKWQAPARLAQLFRRRTLTIHRTSHFTFPSDVSSSIGSWTAQHDTAITFRRVGG
jgi:hypothetical protein